MICDFESWRDIILIIEQLNLLQKLLVRMNVCHRRRLNTKRVQNTGITSLFGRIFMLVQKGLIVWEAILKWMKKDIIIMLFRLNVEAVTLLWIIMMHHVSLYPITALTLHSHGWVHVNYYFTITHHLKAWQKFIYVNVFMSKYNFYVSGINFRWIH